jgi:hypothetical protein
VIVLGGALLLFVALAFVVREARRPPAPSPSASGSSLTDVARTGPAAIGGPMVPASAGPNGREPLAPPPVVLPSAMPDPANPPRWTEPLAMPGTPVPPDPFVAPPMVQDPNRGRVAADAAP